RMSRPMSWLPPWLFWRIAYFVFYYGTTLIHQAPVVRNHVGTNLVYSTASYNCIIKAQVLRSKLLCIDNLHVNPDSPERCTEVVAFPFHVAALEQTMAQQLGDPRRIVDIGCVSWHRLDVLGHHHEQCERALEEIVDRASVDPLLSIATWVQAACWSQSANAKRRNVPANCCRVNRGRVWLAHRINVAYNYHPGAQETSTQPPVHLLRSL